MPLPTPRFSQFRKGKQSMKNLNLTFQAPIKENAFFNDEFLIKGIAITSTVTDNNTKFLPEELDKAAETMTGIPLLVDHDNRVDAVVGKVKQGFFDHISQNLEFEAMIDNDFKPIQEKISRGLLDSVSIGATVEDILEEDGVFIPVGIKIRELSLVAVPADDKAKFAVVSSAPTFQMALQEAFKLVGHAQPETITSDTTFTTFSSSPDNTGHKIERGLVDMDTEKEKEMTELKTQLAEKDAKLAEFEAKERQMLENKYTEICKSRKVDSIDVKEMDNRMLDSLVKQVELMKEADVDEEPKKESEEPEEPKEEPKEKPKEPEKEKKDPK